MARENKLRLLSFKWWFKKNKRWFFVFFSEVNAAIITAIVTTLTLTVTVVITAYINYKAQEV